VKLSDRQIINIASALDTVVCASVGLQLGRSSLASTMARLDGDRPRDLIQLADTVLRCAEKVIERKARQMESTRPLSS
jgi:hypothetical protein